MNDLSTIQRQNAEATERDIPNRTAAGKYVVAEYTGLHFTSYTEWDTEKDANEFACKVGNEVGKRAKVHFPAKAPFDPHMVAAQGVAVAA